MLTRFLSFLAEIFIYVLVAYGLSLFAFLVQPLGGLVIILIATLAVGNKIISFIRLNSDCEEAIPHIPD